MSDTSIALVGGTVRTLDTADTVAEAVLIRDGRVAAVGTTSEISAVIPTGCEVIALRGRTVLPGMIDAHAHLELSTLAEQRWVDARFVDVETVLRRVAEAVAQRARGEWIVAQGTFGQPMPTREQLDDVAPEHPVVVRQSMHFQVANTLALSRAGVDRDYTPRNGIRVYRGADGEATGEFAEGFDIFPAPYPDTEWYVDALARQARESWVRYGVTTVHELPATQAAVAAWQRLDTAGDMPCRITLNPTLNPGHQALLETVDDYLNLGFRTGFGTDHLKLGAVKMFLDGAGPAAWSVDQLLESPASWGVPCFSYNELVGVLTACRRASVQVWMHAVGDVAQWLAVDAVEAVNLAKGRSDHRTRIEHIGNGGTDLALLPRLVGNGAVPVPTSAFMYGNMPTPDLPGVKPVERRDYPYRTLLDAGLRPPGNSDSAGTQPFATNPWYGVQCMVARSNQDGATVEPVWEAIDVATAVRTYTHFGAYVGFEEATKGSLERGKLGDLAVYGVDPFAVQPDELSAVQADLTIVGGRVVHGDA